MQTNKPFNSKTPYSTDDNATINKIIEMTPQNVRYACKKASEALKDRRASAIESHWHISLKRRNAHITCGSSKGFTNNVKNEHVNKVTGELSGPKLNNLLWLMKELLKLDKEDLQAINRIISLK
jgi:hypothetical protein